MLLADELNARGVRLDIEKVLRMALLHDWAETRVGDLPRTATGYFGSQARKHAESAAFEEIVDGMVSVRKLYRDLYDDYEQRESVEARLVKAADVIDLLVQTLALERAGARGLDEFWDVVEKADFHLEGEAQALVNEILHDLLSARTSESSS
jgi:putative hydrolase of HD superfamily